MEEIQKYITKPKKQIGEKMSGSLKMYIGQQLKNSQYRKKHNRRISSIMSQIRFQSQQGEANNDKKIEQLDLITSEFKKKNRGKCNRYSLMSRFDPVDLIVQADSHSSHLKRMSLLAHVPQPQPKPKLDTSTRNAGLKLKRIKGNSSCRGLGELINGNRKFKMVNKENTELECSEQKYSPKFRISLRQEYPAYYQKTLKMSKLTSVNSQASQLSSHLQTQQQKINIQQQNIHKLNSFLRGAYESQINQFSDVINLSIIDRYRRDFQIYDKLYNEMVEMNVQNKISLAEVKQQNFRDVVFVNELKNHATAPEFVNVLKELRIIR